MTVSILQKSVDDENLNRQVIQLNQKAENQKMRSLGINLAILLRSVVCREGMEGEGEGGGGCDILYKLQGYSTTDWLTVLTVRLDGGRNSRETFDH